MIKNPIKNSELQRVGILKLVNQHHRETPSDFSTKILALANRIKHIQQQIIERLDSSLNLFFDVTAPDNLTLDGVYSLGVGLTTMFQKIARTHDG